MANHLAIVDQGQLSPITMNIHEPSNDPRDLHGHARPLICEHRSAGTQSEKSNWFIVSIGKSNQQEAGKSINWSINWSIQKDEVAHAICTNPLTLRQWTGKSHGLPVV